MGENFDRNMALVREVEQIASKLVPRLRRLPSRGCLLKVTTSPRSPAPSASAGPEENIAADDVVLTADQIARLDALRAGW